MEAALPRPLPFPIRTECPPGACSCERDALLDAWMQDAQTDLRVLRVTREEERKLIARIERVDSYADLLHVAELLRRNAGIVLSIAPGPNEVRTVRGFVIRLEDQPGLCRKLRQSIPAAVRRCLEARPEIAFAILDAHDLLGGG